MFHSVNLILTMYLDMVQNNILSGCRVLWYINIVYIFQVVPDLEVRAHAFSLWGSAQWTGGIFLAEGDAPRHRRNVRAFMLYHHDFSNKMYLFLFYFSKVTLHQSFKYLVLYIFHINLLRHCPLLKYNVLFTDNVVKNMNFLLLDSRSFDTNS